MEFTKEQSELLASFVLEVLEDFPDLGGLDPCDLQDLAEKYKILVPHIVHSPCGDDCNCAEFYDNDSFQKGVNCYRIVDWLVRDAQRRIGADDAGQDWTCPNCGNGGRIIRYEIEQCDECGYPVRS